MPLHEILARVQPEPSARYVVFHCADPMQPNGTQPYYESIDMVDAHHPQTMLAYDLNGAALPIGNGAPIRVRIERQLGYKMAKYIMRIELVDSYAGISRRQRRLLGRPRLRVVRRHLATEEVRC